MQFGFRYLNPSDAMFTVWQMQGKHRNKGQKLYYAFADLEKAFDSVP